MRLRRLEALEAALATTGTSAAVTAQLRVQMTGVVTSSGPFQIMSAEDRASGLPVVLKIPRDVLGRDLLTASCGPFQANGGVMRGMAPSSRLYLPYPTGRTDDALSLICRDRGSLISARLPRERFGAALGEGIYDVLDRGDAVRLAEVLGPGVRSGRRIARLITGWADAGADPSSIVGSPPPEFLRACRPV